MEKIETMAAEAPRTSGVATKSGRVGLAVSETSVKAGGSGGRNINDLGKR